jgi:hypothetical protein
VAEFAADGLASDDILRALRGGEHSRNRATGGWRLPARQRLIPGLRIVVPEPVHVAQTGRLSLPIVGMALLDVGFVCRDE